MAEYTLPEDCEALAAAIEAETDPVEKARLEALYAQGCGGGSAPVGGGDSGGGPSGPPVHP